MPWWQGTHLTVMLLSRFRSDNRRGLDWWLDLFIILTHDSWLHFTVHCYSHTRVLSLLQSAVLFIYRAHVVNVRRVSRNWTLVNCHLNYIAIRQLPLSLTTLTNQLLHFSYSTELHSESESELLYDRRLTTISSSGRQAPCDSFYFPTGHLWL
jgi:hypothetical protein